VEQEASEADRELVYVYSTNVYLLLIYVTVVLIVFVAVVSVFSLYSLCVVCPLLFV
jgi:hypothetical protein